MSTQFTNRQWRLPNNENKDKQSNYSMDFDGTGGVYITAGDNNSLSGPFTGYTISAWVKTPTSFNTNYNAVFTKKYSFYFGFHQDNSFINYGSSGTAWGTEYKSTYTFSLDTWYYLTATADGTNIKMYVNGVLNDTFADTNTAQNSNTSNTPYIGGYNNSGDYDTYKGQIDAVAIFDYALSSSQITTLYGSSSTGIGNPMSLSPKPVAYYPLGDQDAFNGADYLVPNSSLKDYVFDFIPNDYIDLGNNVFFNTNNPFSFSTWVNLDSYSDPYPYLANLKTNVTDGIGIFISNNSSYSGVNVGSTDSSITKGKTTGDISGTFLNSWNQVVVTYNGNGANTLSNFLIYVNGSPVTLTSTGTFGTMPNTANNIGRRSNSYHYLDGKMSNVQIFNTALPATGSNSVETLYNNGSPLTSMSGFTSLQGWWKLDASATYDSSTTTWTIEDSSTNSNDGTSYGMNQANLVVSDLSFKTSYSPYALDFDGADDYLDANRTIASNLDFSVSAWINPTSYATVMLGTRNLSSVSTSNGFTMNINSSGNLWGRIFTETSNIIQVQTGSTISLNNWSHVAMTYNSSSKTLKTYLNGSEVGSIIGTDSSVTSTAELNIGRASIGTFYDYFVGKLSNVSIFNTELTSTQVTEIYNQGVPSNLHNFSGTAPVSWWQLGSNSSFNTNWTCLDEIGTNNAVSANMTNSDIVDGVGSYANGLSSGMGGDEVIGDAPYSSSNSLSVNMDVLDRTEDTPA